MIWIDEYKIKKEKLKKDRKCLMCFSIFKSYGPNNRICKKCRVSDIWRDERGVSRKNYEKVA